MAETHPEAPRAAERTREIGMLRAVGMTRRQIRRMVRWESILISLIGAALGIPLGVLLATLIGTRSRSSGSHSRPARSSSS